MDDALSAAAATGPAAQRAQRKRRARPRALPPTLPADAARLAGSAAAVAAATLTALLLGTSGVSPLALAALTASGLLLFVPVALGLRVKAILMVALIACVLGAPMLVYLDVLRETARLPALLVLPFAVLVGFLLLVSRGLPDGRSLGGGLLVGAVGAVAATGWPLLALLGLYGLIDAGRGVTQSGAALLIGLATAPIAWLGASAGSRSALHPGASLAGLRDAVFLVVMLGCIAAAASWAGAGVEQAAARAAFGTPLEGLAPSAGWAVALPAFVALALPARRLPRWLAVAQLNGRFDSGAVGEALLFMALCGVAAIVAWRLDAGIELGRACWVALAAGAAYAWPRLWFAAPVDEANDPLWIVPLEETVGVLAAVQTAVSGWRAGQVTVLAVPELADRFGGEHLRSALQSGNGEALFPLRPVHLEDWEDAQPDAWRALRVRELYAPAALWAQVLTTQLEPTARLLVLAGGERAAAASSGWLRPLLARFAKRTGFAAFFVPRSNAPRVRPNLDRGQLEDLAAPVPGQATRVIIEDDQLLRTQLTLIQPAHGPKVVRHVMLICGPDGVALAERVARLMHGQRDGAGRTVECWVVAQEPGADALRRLMGMGLGFWRHSALLFVRLLEVLEAIEGQSWLPRLSGRLFQKVVGGDRDSELDVVVIEGRDTLQFAALLAPILAVPAPGGAPDVYLTYAREDRPIVVRLASALQARGLRVWFDREILGGASYAEVVERELNRARVVLALWSQRSVRSRYVRDEAERALQAGKLLPVRIEEVASPLGFGQINTLDLVGWNGDIEAPEVAELAAQVQRYFGAGGGASSRSVLRSVAVRSTAAVAAGKLTFPAALYEGEIRIADGQPVDVNAEQVARKLLALDLIPVVPVPPAVAADATTPEGERARAGSAPEAAEGAAAPAPEPTEAAARAPSSSDVPDDRLQKQAAAEEVARERVNAWVWHRKRGETLLAQGDTDAAVAEFEAGLKLLLAMAADAPDDRELRAALLSAHEKIADALTAAGRHGAAQVEYRESLDVADGLMSLDESETRWQRDAAVVHRKLGDALIAVGDSAGALAEYESGLSIDERLAERDADNIWWKRDIAVGRGRVADALLARGDAVGALRRYQEALSVIEPLAQSDPSDAELQRQLFLIHNSLGNARHALHDTEGAAKAYRAATAIAEEFARRDPESAEWQRNLAVCRVKTGNVLLASGREGDALRDYAESRALTEKLVARGPRNALWQRDLSVVLDKIGSVLQALGRNDEANEAFTAGLAIAQRLALEDPASEQYQLDLAASHGRLGALPTSGATERREHLERGRRILLQLLESGSAVVERDRIAWFDQQLGQLDQPA